MRRTLPFAFLTVFTLFFILARPARAEPPADDCYIISYFQRDGQDGLHLAYSHDGLKWTALNGNRSFLKPQVGGDKLMRDPSVTQAPDGTFQMVWTTSWNERVIGHASSKDLIDWSRQQAIPVMAHEPTARNCWAPEIFHDAASGRYVIVWSTTIPGRFPDSQASSESRYNHRAYFTTTTDFESFTPTRLFFDPGHNVIDAFLARSGEEYLMFYKDETLHPEPKKIILLATSERAVGPYKPRPGVVSKQDWVEGPSAIKIGERWIVYYDCYRDGRYGAVASTDLETWTDLTDQLSFPPGTRHGTVFKVSPDVLEKLKAVDR